MLLCMSTPVCLWLYAIRWLSVSHISWNDGLKGNAMKFRCCRNCIWSCTLCIAWLHRNTISVCESLFLGWLFQIYHEYRQSIDSTGLLFHICLAFFHQLNFSEHIRLFFIFKYHVTHFLFELFFEQLFSIIVFGCISSQGWRVDDQTKKDICIYNNNPTACNYGVTVGVIGFLASMGFIAGEYLFEQMSSVKTRKHYVLADLGFSGEFLTVFLFCCCLLHFSGFANSFEFMNEFILIPEFVQWKCS